MSNAPSRYVWVDWLGGEWDLDGYVHLQAGAVGFGMPESQDYVSEGTNLDGQTFNGTRDRARYVMLPVSIDTDDGGIKRQLWRSLRPGKYGTMRVQTNGVWRELTMRPTSKGDQAFNSDPAIFGYEFVTLEFMADQPSWMGDEVLVQFQTAQTPVPFYDTGANVLNLMSSNTVANSTVTNDGDKDAWATYRIVGPATSFTIGYFSPDVVDVAGTITIGPGQYLEINTDPTKQTVLLFDTDGSSTNVFQLMSAVGFRQIPEGVSVPIYITLNGAGSLSVSFRPKYDRAYADA